MNKFFSILLFGLVFFIACENAAVIDDISNARISEDAFLEDVTEETSTGVDGCFEIIFPISLVFSDSSIIEVNSWQEARIAVRAADEIPDLLYPINLMNGEGDTIVVNDKDNLDKTVSECEDYDERCFEFVFPVSIIFPDGTITSYDDKTALKEGLRTWAETNKDSSENRPSLQFPINVIIEGDDSLTVINSKEELKDLKAECRGDKEYPNRDDYREKCFEFVFPVSIIFPDGTITSYDDKTALKEGLRTWAETNKDSSENRPSLQFPINVIIEGDDSLTVINSKEELKDLKAECRGDKEYPNRDDYREKCFEFVFPVSIIFPDGTITSYDDKTALKEGLRTWVETNKDSLENRPSLQFPINVIIEGDDSLTVINSKEELKDLKAECRKDRNKDHDYDDENDNG